MQTVLSVIDVIKDTALDSIVASNLDGEVVAVNELACEMFGWRECELVGKTIGETIVPPRLREAHAAGVARYCETGVARVLGKRIEIDAVRSDGAEFPVELTITEIEDRGCKYFVSYIRDISERHAQRAIIEKARDDAEKVAETQSQLIAMLSHDLRTPLNAITSALEIALRSADEEEIRAAAKLARRAATTAHVLTEDLLSYAQLEAGALKLSPTPIILKHFGEEVEEKWKEQFEARGLSFHFAVRVDENDTVMMDRIRVHQIVDNLLSNALKFTQQGGAEVDLSWGQPGRIEMRIADSGQGFGDFDLEQAFAPFARGHDGGGGVGLGLWIVKSLADLHGGDISLAPRLGGGTVARVELPLVGAPTHLRANHQLSRLASLRVLVVDDNDTNRFVAARMLEKCGAKVEVARHGVEAVERASEKFDVILMDLDMPVMDGFEATERIRANDDSTVANTLIIALTAYSTREHEMRIRRAGANGLLAKPIQGTGYLENAILLHLSSEADESPTPGDTEDAAPQDDAAYLIDLSILQTLARALGSEGLTALATKFKKDVLSGISNVEDQCRDSDFSGLRRTTHMLGAVAGTVGATPLQELAAKLNRACHASDHENFSGVAQSLVETAKATLLEFEKLWKQLS